MKKQWFEVDRTGLGKQAEQQPKGRLVGELIQNALDEAGVTRIDVTLTPVPGRPLAELSVADDAVAGFADLAHAYTLFAPSRKRDNPEQRGQFNLGEKLVLAVCESARLPPPRAPSASTPSKAASKARSRSGREGRVFQGRIKLTREEFSEVCDYLRSLLLPEQVVVTFNGERLLPRTPVRTLRGQPGDRGGRRRGRHAAADPKGDGAPLRAAAR